MAPEYGGGSITALPIIETQAGDVSAYIPTNVISITDGQIFLETELFHAGIMPAVNPGLSVSRVGGNAQIKAMKKVSGTLKLLYSQYRELQSFAQFGSDLDDDTRARLGQGERIVAVLKQNHNAPVSVEHQVCILYAVVHDHLKEVAVELIPEYEVALYERLDAQHADMLATIRDTGDLSKETENLLKAAIQAFTADFLKLHADKEGLNGRSIHEGYQAANPKRGKHDADHEGDAAGGLIQAEGCPGPHGGQQALYEGGAYRRVGYRAAQHRGAEPLCHSPGDPPALLYRHCR